MSTISALQPTPLRTILLDRLREGNQRVGDGRNVAEVVRDNIRQDQLLGIGPRPAVEEQTEFVAPPDEVTSEPLTPPLLPTGPEPQLLVPTANGLETQFLTGLRLDLLV